jgi:NADH dehydrogenase
MGDGLKVAVVGGGPAGSFFALNLLHYASERGIQPDITIYQERDFNKLGRKGCKGCAGILSPTLLGNLKDLDLTMPEEIVQSRIDHYTVHSPYTSISIANPEKGVNIASVFRGGGPLISHYEDPISFDGWLLKQAEERGARIENKTISRICIEKQNMVEISGELLPYDLVVLASGINSKTVPIEGLEYIPSKARIMVQAEIYAGIDQVETLLGNEAHAFLIPHSGLIFGTLVPKGPFINVSVLSNAKHRVSIKDLLNQEIVRKMLPERYEHTCGCSPRASISAVRNYYTDGFVAVGDAAVSRLYKDGIGSSLVTAREAARIVAHYGLSCQDFERHYKPFCSSIDQDNKWGRLLFSINDRAKDSRIFHLVQHRLIGNEQDNMRGPQPFTKAAWGMFTGSYSYKSISRMTLNPVSLVKFFSVSIIESLNSLLPRRHIDRRKLFVGTRKVLILGSGFGGTYVLRHLVPSLNRNENVKTIMISDENFLLFSPLLHEVAMGRIETRHIAYPIRRLQWRDRFKFIHTSVKQIDLSGRRVLTNTGSFDFDDLVLALGSVADTSELSTTDGNVFTMKTLQDSMLIRNHIIRVFEQANTKNDPLKQRQLLTFIVTGAGYVGIQLVTELRDFIYKHLIKFYRAVNPDNIRVILIERESKIAAGLHTKLGAYTIKLLVNMGIEVKLRSQVTHVWKNRVEINGTEIVPAQTLIWVASRVANPRIAELDVSKDTIGRVLVNEYLKVPGVPGVYAIGDCAHFKDPKSGQPIPPKAHTAVRQAKVVAYNILADIRGRRKRTYRYSDNAEMVSLGTSKAVFRFHGLRLYGFPARLIWLAAYSLLITGMYNRIRIILDWVLSFIFGRDTTFIRLKK